MPNCEVLLANGAVPDLAATGEMTPLRAAVKVGNTEMTKWLLKQPGTWSRRWDNAFFALLLHKTPAAAVEYLDTFAVVQNHSKLGNAAVYYSHLRAIYGDPSVAVEATALGVAATSPNGKHVLSHRVLRHVMKAKWQSFAKRMFRREFAVYCTLVASYYVPTIWADPNWVQLASKFDYWVACCRTVSWVCSFYLLLHVEYHEFKGTGATGGGGMRAYFRSFWNVLNFTSYVATLVTIPLEFIASLAEERDCLLALITVTLWVNLLQFLQVTTHSGLLLAMMSRMRRDVFRFFILYGVFLLGFSGAFYLLLRGRTGFESYRAAFLTVLLMLFGNLEYETFGSTSGWTWHVANALLFVYLLAAVLVLLNILIAMMATTYGDIWDAAEAETMLCHAQAIVRMETALSDSERERKYRALLSPRQDDAATELELPYRVEFERQSSTQGLRTHLDAKKAMAASIVAKMKAMPAQALAASPTWTAVQPLVAQHAPTVNLSALREALFLKSTFDEESAGGELLGDDRGRELGLLDDGVRYEAPVRPHTEPKAETELLVDLQTQVQQLTALVKELGSSAVAPVPVRRHRKSLVRYASPVDLV